MTLQEVSKIFNLGFKPTKVVQAFEILRNVSAHFATKRWFYNVVTKLYSQSRNSPGRCKTASSSTTSKSPLQRSAPTVYVKYFGYPLTPTWSTNKRLRMWQSAALHFQRHQNRLIKVNSRVMTVRNLHLHMGARLCLPLCNTASHLPAVSAKVLRI